MITRHRVCKESAFNGPLYSNIISHGLEEKYPDDAHTTKFINVSPSSSFADEVKISRLILASVECVLLKQNPPPLIAILGKRFEGVDEQDKESR